MMACFPELRLYLEPVGVPDAAAGAWPPDVVSRLLTVYAGLIERYAEDRMPLSDALQELEAIALLATEEEPPAAATSAAGGSRSVMSSETAGTSTRKQALPLSASWEMGAR